MHVTESLVFVHSDATRTHKTSVADVRQRFCRFHATGYAANGLVLLWQLSPPTFHRAFCIASGRLVSYSLAPLGRGVALQCHNLGPFDDAFVILVDS